MKWRERTSESRERTGEGRERVRKRTSERPEDGRNVPYVVIIVL